MNVSCLEKKSETCGMMITLIFQLVRRFMYTNRKESELSMEKCEINNKTELNLYCNLLSVAYELYKDKTDGMVCGSEAENIRDRMYKAIKEAGIISTK